MTLKDANEEQSKLLNILKGGVRTAEKIYF